MHKRREDVEEADHFVMVEEMKRFKQLVFPCAQFMKRENKRDILYVEQENYVGIEEKKELVDTNGDNFNRNLGFCSHVKSRIGFRWDRLIELSLISSHLHS